MMARAAVSKQAVQGVVIPAYHHRLTWDSGKQPRESIR